MASEKDFAGNIFAERFNGTLQSFAVPCGLAGMRRAEWPKLAKWEIATKNGETIVGKTFRYREQ